MTSWALKDAILTTPPSVSPTDQAIYVYAFVDAGRSGDLPQPHDGERPLSLHRVGAIAAVISQVPVAEFCSIEGERNLTDPAWIMPRLCRHEAVVERTMAWSPVFPLRFATLYVSLNSLTDFMLRHKAAIASFLRQVAGHQEWALKITAELDNLMMLDELAAELWPDWSGYPPGTRYLRLCQERSGLRKAARERAARLIPSIVDELRPLAVAIRPLVRSADSPDADQQYVEDYALLVSVRQQPILDERLHELAAECAHQRLHVTLSGPWPPYSFRPALDERSLQQGQ